MKKTAPSSSTKIAKSAKSVPGAKRTKTSKASASLPSYTQDEHLRGYPDLHDHVAALDKAGLLIKVERKINKDTEMHPLVR